MPPNMTGNPEAVYQVTLLPGGDVLEANLTKSSGVPAYDDAVGRAIMAAQPLPVPSGPLFQKYFRKITLKFRPRE
jgi:colicin import membrane protein